MLTSEWVIIVHYSRKTHMCACLVKRDDLDSKRRFVERIDSTLTTRIGCEEGGVHMSNHNGVQCAMNAMRVCKRFKCAAPKRHGIMSRELVGHKMNIKQKYSNTLHICWHSNQTKHTYDVKACSWLHSQPYLQHSEVVLSTQVQARSGEQKQKQLFSLLFV